MTVRSVTGLVIAFCSVLSACGSKESVMLSARLESPELSVTSNALVTDVTGRFELVLALGDRASDPSTVTLGPFSLQRDSMVLLDPLNLEAQPSFPMEIGVGASKRELHSQKVRAPSVTGLSRTVATYPMSGIGESRMQ